MKAPQNGLYTLVTIKKNFYICEYLGIGLVLDEFLSCPMQQSDVRNRFDYDLNHSSEVTYNL